MQSLEITDDSYADVLTRIRDSADDVRAAAFHVLGERLDLHGVKMADRAFLLEQGLHDRDASVRAACEQLLLRKWLRFCDDCPIQVSTAAGGLSVEPLTVCAELFLSFA